MNIATTRRASTPRGPSLPSEPPAGSGNGTGDGGSGGTDTLDSILNMGSVIADTREAASKTRRVVTRSIQEIKADLPKSEREDAEIQARITNADFKSVQEQGERDERDFAQALQAVHEVSQSMEVEFKNLVTPTAEELAIVQAAKDKVADLEKEITEKEQPGFFRSLPILKGRHQNLLVTLRAELAAAKLAVPEAESRMAKQVRQRLMDASMDNSVQAYVELSKKTEEIMKSRVGELDVQIKILNDRRVYALGEKETAAKKMTTLTEQLKAKEAELTMAQESLQAMPNGSNEYSAQEKVVSELMVAVEKIRSDREASLTYFQSKEAALKHLELGHLAAIKLRGRHQARILRLHSDTEERARMYPAHLLNMKTMSDQAFDKLIRTIGVGTDQNISEANAQAIVAADNDFMEGIEEHPDILRRNESINKALRTHFIQMRGRTERMLKMIEEGYDGVNPGNSLFAPPTGDDGEVASDPGTAAVPESTKVAGS